MTTKNNQENAKKYSCEKCHFECSKKSEWSRHIVSSKHTNTTDYNILETKIYNCNCGKSYTHRASLYNHKKTCISAKSVTHESEPKNNIILNVHEPFITTPLLFSCRYCNKNYKGRNGLWYHEQKCEIKKDTISIENISVENTSVLVDSSANEIKVLTNLVLELVKSNTKLQEQMLEVCKTTQTTTTTISSNNSNNNSNNKTFNLQFYLNEECKDAMNLKDFVQSFKLQLSDLELVGEEGYVDGMTKVILAKVNTTEANKRPFHCSDAKRDTLYVKDNDVWAREGPDNAKMVAAVKAIGHQNFTVLKEYKALHPDCESTYSEYNDHYMNLIMKSAGSQPENLMKVVKKVAKEIVIEK